MNDHLDISKFNDLKIAFQVACFLDIRNSNKSETISILKNLISSKNSTMLSIISWLESDILISKKFSDVILKSRSSEAPPPSILSIIEQIVNSIIDISEKCPIPPPDNRAAEFYAMLDLLIY